MRTSCRLALYGTDCIENERQMSSSIARETFWTTLTRRPSPEDVQSVVQFSPGAATVTAINALIFAAGSQANSGSNFTLVWTCVTLAVCAFIMLRAKNASVRQVEHVSRRGARRVVIFSIALALPWGILALAVLGSGSPDDQLLVLMVCAGMSAGGAFILHRTLLAATAFYVTILGSVLIACAIHSPLKMLPIAIYTILYGLFLMGFAYMTGVMARQRDRSVGQLSTSVADLKEAHSEISSLAFFDPLTGLPNRTSLDRRLHEMLSDAAETRGKVGIFLLDLDRFRLINDGIGHAAGDDVLQHVAIRLSETLRDGGLIARLWADEFAFLVSGIDGPADMAKIAARVIEAVSEPTQISGRSVYLGASIGASLFPDHGKTEASLLRAADIALHRSKETGRGRFTLYRNEMSDRVAAADRMERDLHAALSDGQISVHYQPKVELHTGAAVGAEALVRWHHPEDGFIPPDLFLTLAADRGMMPDVTARIFEVVSADILALRHRGLDFGKIAINIHPLDLKSPNTLLSHLRQLLASGIEVSDVVIEITEGCFVGRGSDDAALALDAISDFGFELSLDDFGTGHASLSHLRKLPVQELKIDREFVTGICTNQHDRAIVSATIEIARCLQLRTVAEGVETKEQIEALQSIGADLGQGYHWCRPVPRADFEAFLTRCKSEQTPRLRRVDQPTPT